MMKREWMAAAIWVCVAVAGAWSMSGCSGVAPDGAPPSELVSPVDHPADHKIFFETEDLRHVVELFDDGSYLFKSGNSQEGVVAKREGRWLWKKLGEHRAELTLDRDVWLLTFAGYDSAFAVNKSAAGSTRVFQFERMQKAPVAE